jgi:hypothetical protein
MAIDKGYETLLTFKELSIEKIERLLECKPGHAHGLRILLDQDLEELRRGKKIDEIPSFLQPDAFQA